MAMRRTTVFSLCWAVVLSIAAAGCSVSVSQSEEERRAREEKTREEAARAAAKAKPALEEAGRKIGEAADRVATGARAAAQGAEEGWKRSGHRVVDLNTASESDLMDLPGIGRNEARKIIAGRPYRNRHDLVTKRILTENEYARIREQTEIK
ncbi:MAG TPA: helix-hairpin-helix domain-containing protein [Candidatus Dormibacteraeota bacterium]|nr:helix-hairpin-helix domain-containing protein [Candidatus Dormibacteraeota bacterium]